VLWSTAGVVRWLRCGAFEVWKSGLVLCSGSGMRWHSVMEVRGSRWTNCLHLWWQC
jgi:hypothetical protein